MSRLSSYPRIIRKNDPKKTFPKSRYRKALSELIEDFDNRCAYSMQYLGNAANSEKEIDHFNPASKKRAKVKLGELMLSSGHCNGAKSDWWPIKSERDKGIRFLNPCMEGDYGVEIFEDIETGFLDGTTPKSIWHILKLGLNAPHLVRARLRRTYLHSQLKEFDSSVYLFSPKAELITQVITVNGIVEFARKEAKEGIPIIPAVTKPAPTTIAAK